MKIKLIALLCIIANIGFTQNLFTKGISKLSKMAGKGNDVMTSTLDDVAPTVGIMSNLYPKEVGTISQSFFNSWVPGGDLTTLMFTKKTGPGYYKIDGTVTIDGKPVDYLTSGLYGISATSNSAPRLIEITTTSGQKSSFTIETPRTHIKLLSINGQSDNISLDLTKDVVLELDAHEIPDNTLLKLSIAINQMSIKSFYDVCFVKKSSKITIPAAAFRNINIVPGGKNLYNYKKSYLSIGTDVMENAKDVTGSFSSFQYRSINEDGKFVTIITEPALNTGLVAKGTESFNNGPLEYNFFKPGAFVSRPIEQLTKIGVTSFAIRGTTFTQQMTESATQSRTVTLTFPQQSDETWDALLEKIYPEFIAVVKSQLAPVIPLENVTKTEAYKSLVPMAKDDANTKVEFSRSYKNTKVISAFMPVSEGYGVNGANERIMKESGANGLLNLTIDLQVEADKDNNIIMSPKLAFEIVGLSNGTTSTTKFYSGVVYGKGVPFNDKMLKVDLEKIIRTSDLVAAFAKGLKEIKEKEKANSDYQTVWNLQK